MQTNTYFIDRKKAQNINFLEKSVISKTIEVLNSKEITTELIEKTKEALENYYLDLFLRENEYSVFDRAESLTRFTKFLINYPCRHEVDAERIEAVYESMWLLDMATYCLNQMSSVRIASSSIERFLDYIEGTEAFKLYAIYMYRINPKYIGNIRETFNVESLTEKELYYGVTTGFFEYGKDGNKAIDQLKKLSAAEVLNKLSIEGFIV